VAHKDHSHDILSGSPSSIGSGNSAGTSPSVPHLDHVHDHGALAGGDRHALASGAAHGFESSSNFTKLAGIATGATNTPLGSATPQAVDGGAASAGVSTNAARDDHKHALTASSIGLRQTDFVEVVSNLSRNNSTYADMSGVTLTMITLAGGIVLLDWTCSVANSVNNSNAYFALQVDGVTVASAVAAVAAGAGTIASAAIRYRVTGLSATAHTFKVRWRTTGGGTVSLNPSVDGQFGSLVAQEVTV
jgi:hypothetical protein